MNNRNIATSYLFKMNMYSIFPLVRGACFATIVLAIGKIGQLVDTSWVAVAAPVPAAVAYALAHMALSWTETTIERAIVLLDEVRHRIDAKRPNAELSDTENRVIPSLTR